MKSKTRRDFLIKTGAGLAGVALITPEVSVLAGPGSPNTKNTWIKLSQDAIGARRSSAIRYADVEEAFLLWGYHGYVSSDYGNPEKPWDGNNEYDIVAFDTKRGSWKSHLPKQKAQAWADNPPPMHMCSYYQGITVGSHRPQLKVREGVLRPDLNIVFDQVTYDSQRNRMVYFTGGRTFAYAVRERAWVDICQENSAPPVLGGSLCYDPVGDKIILAGGGHVAEKDRNGHLTGSAGTWIFDCRKGSWAPANCLSELPDRMVSRLVYDTKNRLMVLFGGDNHTHYLSDTWIFDPAKNQWRKSAKAEGPVARAGHFTVYDPGTGWVIIGGGYNREDLTDMWGYDLASDQWHRLRGQVPSGFYISADIASKDGKIVLTTATKRVGDTMGCNEIYPVRTTWAYQIDKKDLVDAGVHPVRQQNMAKRAVEEALEGTTPDAARRTAQMQLIAGMGINQWVEFRNPGRTAPARTWGSCSFDVNRGRIVYWGGGHCGYGGNDYDFYDVEHHTWIPSPAIAPYPERNWDKSGGVYPAGLMFGGTPFMRHGRKAYAWDPVSNLAINMKYIFLTAGYEPDFLKDCHPVNPDFGSGENFNMSGYSKWVTWTYDDRTEKWDLLCPALQGLDLLVSTPHGVMGVNYFWSAINSKNRYNAVTYQGEEVIENAVYLLKVADKEWKKLTSTGPWPQNLYELTALVYDSRRDQLILHGAGPERDELWRFHLDQGRWEKIEPRYDKSTKGRAPVCYREAVYLPKEDVFLTAGRPAGEQGDAGFWAYHVGENLWRQLAVAPPEGRTMKEMIAQNRAWAYDPIHDIVFMVMSRSGDSSRSVVYGIRINL